MSSSAQIPQNRERISFEQLDQLGDLYLERGIYESEIQEVRDILSKGNHAVKDSKIQKIRDIYTKEEKRTTGIKNSNIGTVRDIKADIGIKASKVEKVRGIAAKTAVKGSLINNKKSKIGSIRHIKANKGIKNSEIGSIQTITANKGIINSKIDKIQRITTQDIAVRNSKINEINNILTESNAVLNSEIQQIGNTITQSTLANRSKIHKITGNTKTGATAFYKSKVNRIHGNIDSTSQTKKDGYLKNRENHEFPELREWTDKETWLGGHIKKRHDIFNETHLPYAVSDEIKGKTLDKQSFGGFIAADEVDVTNYEDNMMVVTPNESDQFTTYKGDWKKFKKHLEERDETLKGLSVFNPEIKEIESIEHLENLEENYLEKIDQFNFSDIRENIEYIGNFNQIEEEYFVQLLDNAIDTMEESKLRNVKQFSQTFSKLPSDLQNEIVDTLDVKEKEPGKDLFNIGKKRKYNQFLYNETEQIIDLLDGDNRIFDKINQITIPDEEIQAETNSKTIKNILKQQRIPQSLGNWLKQEYLGLREGNLQQLMRKIGRKEEFGELPQIDPSTFGKDSPYRQLLEKVINQRSREFRRLNYLGRSADEDYDPDLGLKSKEGRLQFDPNFTLEDENFETLWDHVQKEAEKDLEYKKRDYLFKALQDLGKRELREEYESIIGEEIDRDEFSRSEIAALTASRQYVRNRDIARKVIDPSVHPADEEENESWLKENGFTYEDLTDVRPETYSVDISQGLESTIKDKERDLIDEMDNLASKLGDFSLDSIEDVVRLEARIDRSDVADQKAYDRLFEDKIRDYEAIEDQVRGVPGQVTVRVADPLKSMMMGNYFTNSCLAVGKTNGWSVAANAFDVNKQVIYAEDEEGDVVGRVLTAVTDDGRLEDFGVYNNSGAAIEEAFDDFLDNYADRLGVERVPGSERARNVDVLAADRWYDRQLY